MNGQIDVGVARIPVPPLGVMSLGSIGDLDWKDKHPTPELLGTYVETPPFIPSAERDAIQAHLGSCPACSAKVANLRAVCVVESGLVGDQSCRSTRLGVRTAVVEMWPNAGDLEHDPESFDSEEVEVTDLPLSNTHSAAMLAAAQHPRIIERFGPNAHVDHRAEITPKGYNNNPLEWVIGHTYKAGGE